MRLIIVVKMMIVDADDWWWLIYHADDVDAAAREAREHSAGLTLPWSPCRAGLEGEKKDLDFEFPSWGLVVFFLVTWCHWRCLDWEQLSTGRRQCVKSTNIFFILTKWCLGVRQDRLKVFNPQKKSALPAFEETHRRLKKHQDLSNQEGDNILNYFFIFA